MENIEDKENYTEDQIIDILIWFKATYPNIFQCSLSDNNQEEVFKYYISLYKRNQK